MAKLAVACSLDGAALAGRQAELRAGVLAEAQSVERLSNGYRWRFDTRPDLLARLGPILDAERRCCRFLSIALTAEPDLGVVVLEITGPDGTPEFLEEWIDGGTGALHRLQHRQQLLTRLSDPSEQNRRVGAFV